MKAFLIALFVLVLAAVGYYLWAPQMGDTDIPAGNALAGYFQEKLTSLGVEEIGQPIEGFDADLLIAGFPGLVEVDFNGVETLEGHYEIQNGALVFMRDQQNPVSSAEKTVSKEGYATLLLHVSTRFGIAVTDNASIDAIIALLNTSDRIETRINEGATAFGVQVVPLEVLEDSRCPVDVQCIWAGTVRVRTLLTSGLGEAGQVFELNKPITTEAEEVTLVEVLPEPRSGQKISSGDYRFIFKISKKPVQ